MMIPSKSRASCSLASIVSRLSFLVFLLVVALAIIFPQSATSSFVSFVESSENTDSSVVGDVEGSDLLEVGFCLDTTGSMGGLISAAKEKIWSIATGIVEKHPRRKIRMALVAYRDIGDDYVTRVLDLTSDIDSLYRNLMEFRADGGGDMPESVNQALNEAVTKISWTKSATKVLFLVGDAPPHMDYSHDVKYQVTCSLARELGIRINTILCGDDSQTEEIWREIADLGKGAFIQLQRGARGETVRPTPFDEKLASLEEELEESLVHFGGEHIRKAKERKKTAEELRGRMGFSSLAARAEYQVSSAGYHDNLLGENELVEMFSDGAVDLESIQLDLPEELQSLSIKDQRSYLEEKAAKRSKTIAEINRLTELRKTHIRDLEEENDAESFADSVLDEL